MKKNLVIIGAGGHANSCTEVINLCNLFNIVGYVDSTRKNEFNFKIIGSDEDIKKISIKNKYFFIGIGQIKNWKKRYDIYTFLNKIGVNLPFIISPNAIVAKNVTIGKGTIVMNGVIINSGAKIGSNCIINTGSIIEHDTVIEDHCHIAPGCILNGKVIVREKNFIGSGSILNNNIIISKKNVIRSGNLIPKNIDDSKQ